MNEIHTTDVTSVPPKQVTSLLHLIVYLILNNFFKVKNVQITSDTYTMSYKYWYYTPKDQILAYRKAQIDIVRGGGGGDCNQLD